MAALSNLAWMVASKILVFIHALTDWMVAPLGPSRSRYIGEPWHLKLSSCSAAVGKDLPKRSVFCTGLLGGIGVKVLGALCDNGECKGGGISRSRRTGVAIPLSSIGGSAGWESSGCTGRCMEGSA